MNKSVKTTKISRSRSDTTFQWISIVICVFVLLITLYPLYFIIIASVSDPESVYNGYVTLWAYGFNTEGYSRIINDITFWRTFLNSGIYMVVGTSIGVIITMMIAFPLSRNYFAGKGLVTLLLLIPMYFNGGLIPTYLLVRKLGLVGSGWAVILLGCFSIFNVIIARTFLQTNIPHELDEAAYVEGCSYFKYFIMFVLPLSKAIIAVLILYYGIGIWNDYTVALIYINAPEKYPLQLRLYEMLINSQIAGTMLDDNDLGYATYKRNLADSIKYGMIVISALPMMILYPFLQKYFVKGVLIGSLKG